MESDAGRTMMMVVNHEFWRDEVDFTNRKERPLAKGNRNVCVDCGEILDWRSPPRTCACCRVSVCAKHSGHAEMHVARGQEGGGRYTFCTYCLDKLKVSERTLLAGRNTHANATIPPTANPLAAAVPARVRDGGIPSSPSSAAPAAAPAAAVAAAAAAAAARLPRQPASCLGHRKCDETQWRDCSSLFGSTRRNRLPPGQPSAAPIARNAEGGLLPLPVRGASTPAPAADVIRVRWCTHGRGVRWATYNPFQYSKRDTAGGGHQTWIDVEESVLRSSRRKDVNVSLLRWRSAESESTPRKWTSPLVVDEEDVSRSEGTRSTESSRTASSTSGSTSRSAHRVLKSALKRPGSGGVSSSSRSTNRSRSSTPTSKKEKHQPPPWVKVTGSALRSSGRSDVNVPLLLRWRSDGKVPLEDASDAWSTDCSSECSDRDPGSPFFAEEQEDVQTQQTRDAEGKEPSTTKSSSGYFGGFPKMAGGAMAVIGVAATIGVMVLRRRR